MRKIVEIALCYRCPSYIFKDEICDELGKHILMGKIPKDCPLPNAPEGAQRADTTKQETSIMEDMASLKDILDTRQDKV
jgi:hypothetical protein